MDATYVAVVVALLIFLASVVSVEVALSAAIIEIAAGVIAGNFLGLHPAPWMDFLASFGGILLTFLAGAEVDPQLLKDKFKESLLIGGLSFLVPYLAAVAYCYWVAHWTWEASRLPAVPCPQPPWQSSMPCWWKRALRIPPSGKSSWPPPL